MPVDAPTIELLGRRDELAALSAGTSDVRHGRPCTFLVGGEAGIGKTRLLTEMATRSGERVLWGRCLPLGQRGVPHLALMELLRGLEPDERHAFPPVLRALLGDRDGGEDGPAGRPQLVQSVLDLLRRLSSSCPLVVVVEDLHWADEETTDLLEFVVSRLRGERVLLAVSFRSDDLPAAHPLRSTLAEWQRQPTVRRLDLEPLGVADGCRLVAALLARTDDPRDLSRADAVQLVERAGGNPLLIEELVMAGPRLRTAPGHTRDLLLRRIRDVPPDLVRVLRIAAAGGPGIDDGVLARVAGLDVAATRELLRTGIEAQLLAVDDRGCRFRHALLAEALHDDLLPAERREYHDAYANALASAASPAAPAELAEHLAVAGRFDEAMVWWVEAGETAERQFAFSAAQHGYQAALDLWDRVPDPVTHAGIARMDLLRRLAEAAFLAGAPTVACRTARAALDEVDEQDDPVAAALLHDRLARYLRNTDEHASSLAIQKRAVELVPDSPPSRERADVLSGLALIHQFENRYPEAHRLSLEAIGIARETGAVEAEIRARNTLGETQCVLDDLDRGLATIEQARQLAVRSGNAHEQARALWNAQANRFFGSRLAEFVEQSDPVIAALRETQPHWVVDHLVDTADALQMLGRWDEADALLDAATRESPTIAHRIGLVEMLVARGQLDDARELVEEQASRLVGYVGPDVTGRVLNLVQRSRVALAAGGPADAVHLVDELLGRFPDLDKPTYLCHGLGIAIRAAAELAGAARRRGQREKVLDAIGTGDRLLVQLRRLAALLGPANGWKREVACVEAQARAERSRLHGRIDPGSWQESDERWSALAMPYRAAYPRYRWAEAELARGADRERIAPVLVRLRAFLADLGAGPLEGEVVALARRARIDLGDGFDPDPYGLTEREREVLTHVARGMTNRQIGEALYISPKTASVHVSHILQKLSAANRGEAAARAVADGLVEVGELQPGP